MSILSDLEPFVAVHRGHGRITAGASAPMPDGYQAWAVCPRFAVWTRWVTEGEAATDLLKTDFPTFPN